jgi:hypothetical protein
MATGVKPARRTLKYKLCKKTWPDTSRREIHLRRSARADCRDGLHDDALFEDLDVLFQVLCATRQGNTVKTQIRKQKGCNDTHQWFRAGTCSQPFGGKVARLAGGSCAATSPQQAPTRRLQPKTQATLSHETCWRSDDAPSFFDSFESAPFCSFLRESTQISTLLPEPRSLKIPD